MRTLAMVILGLVIGLVAGALLTSAVARPFVGDGGHVPVGAGILLGAIMPVLGIGGAVAAVVIDHRSRGTSRGTE